MATPPTPAIRALPELLARAADLKGELVRFAQGPRYQRKLRGQVAEAADQHGLLDEGMLISVIDRFALQYRRPDGRTVIEDFIARRRPPLPDNDRDMLLGWRDVVEGCFEVRRNDGDSVVLHNLIDDLVYTVHSNVGAAAFRGLRRRMFTICRIVPLHPSSEAWLVSGHLAVFERSAGHELARIAADQVMTRPELLERNPELLRRAWEVQAEHRAEFVATFGSDLVVLPPREADAALRRHFRRVQEKAAAATTDDPGPGLPDDLLDADTVAIVFDDVEGLTFYRDFGRIDMLFADPHPNPDRDDLARLREYLGDDSVSPLAIRRLVQRHPHNADAVFRALLRKPGFSWARDGEALLRQGKKSYFACEPRPSTTVLGERLAELLRGR
jgi:hypothetical protein